MSSPSDPEIAYNCKARPTNTMVPVGRPNGYPPSGSS
jgi:hypothetical protein